MTSPVSRDIYLYEDAQGKLYLLDPASDSVYRVQDATHLLTLTFNEACQAVLTQDSAVGRWEEVISRGAFLNILPANKKPHLIAIWRGPDNWTLINTPGGPAAQALLAFTRNTPEDVLLYEDNAGGLWLIQRNGHEVFAFFPGGDQPMNRPLPTTLPMTFEEAAALVRQGALKGIWPAELAYRLEDTLDLLAHPETHHIATWHGPDDWTLERAVGSSAQRFLGITSEEAEDGRREERETHTP